MITKKQRIIFLASCIFGMILSCYALFVEIQSEKNNNYKAYCDVNEYVSCTKAFSSKYGKGFGLIGPILGEESILNQPNSLGGICFYFILALMSFSDKASVVKLQMIACIISNLLSVYLACILYFILQDFCMICVGTYVVNAINLALSVSKWKLVKSNEKLSYNGNDKLFNKKE